MRNKLLFLVLFIIGYSGLVAAEDLNDSHVFAPETPELIGQGGSFTAVAHGYNSLFTNPAGFARKGGSFTLLSTTASDIETLITGKGIGSEANVGTGLVGRGLGLGIVGNINFYEREYEREYIDAVYDWAFIGGLAFPISLGPVKAYVGGDLRYMMRTEAKDIGIIDFNSFTDSSEKGEAFPVYSGSGLGFDFGAILEYRNWSLGFSARDIGGTLLGYTKSTTRDIGNLFTFNEKGEAVDSTYSIPMVTSYGIGYDPEGMLFPAWVLDPIFHAEYRKTYCQDEEINAEEINQDPFWSGLHMGMEVEVLNFIKLRAGINQGYSTYGLGMKILFLDLNASFSTRSAGRDAWVKLEEGFTMEAAIRF